MKIANFISILYFFCQSVYAIEVSTQSKLLGYCEFVYFYNAQYLQMMNNEGAAKNMLRRSSIMTTANFIFSNENGVISGEKIKIIKEEGLKQKKLFDVDKLFALQEASRCDRDANPIAISIRNSEQKLWGKTFDELQSALFEESMKNMGIK